MLRLLARRPALAAALTVAALVELLRLRGPAPAPPRTTVHALGRAPAHAAGKRPGTPRPALVPRRSATPSPSPSASRGPGARPVPRRTAPPPSATRPPSHSPSPTATTRTFDGDAVDMRYGTVQVRITVRGTRITDVEALQLPDSSRQSRQINDYAGPQLRQEALDAQSANIDTVSGATYTSDAYRTSLQSAIDRWHG